MGVETCTAAYTKSDLKATDVRLCLIYNSGFRGLAKSYVTSKASSIFCLKINRYFGVIRTLHLFQYFGVHSGLHLQVGPYVDDILTFRFIVQ
jgi:hypothetical protein